MADNTPSSDPPGDALDGTSSAPSSRPGRRKRTSDSALGEPAPSKPAAKGGKGSARSAKAANRVDGSSAPNSSGAESSETVAVPAPAEVSATTAPSAASIATSSAPAIALAQIESDPARLDRLEQATRGLGQQLWERRSRRSPSILEARWWDDRILEAAMSDESVKLQMFRFVDVLPRLRTHAAVTRHLQEYFEETRQHLPWAVSLVRAGVEAVPPQSVLSRALAFNARQNALRMARRFIAGSTQADILKSVTELRQRGYAFTLDLLGEGVISDPEADHYAQQYQQLLTDLGPEVARWSRHPTLDEDHLGDIPRLNVSIKLSALVSQFRPIDPVGTTAAVCERLLPLLRQARSIGAHVQFDMEQYAFKPLTLSIFREVLGSEEFRDWGDVGIVLQAYLVDAERDAAELLEWVRQRGTSISVRLVKGAYWDYETIQSASRGWPVPVFQQKWQTDACYERLTRFLLENYDELRPAFGSHNLRSLCHAVAAARELGVPRDAYELQMLYGMAGDTAELFRDQQIRVRLYTPFGELIPGMAYLVRRLLENTSNDSFLRQSTRRHVDLEDLLMSPQAASRIAPPPQPLPKPAFENEPLTDFSQAQPRAAMAEAIAAVRARLGDDYPLSVGGKAVHNRKMLLTRNPSHIQEVVGRVASGTPEDALAAIESARLALLRWSKVEVEYRAQYLDLLAQELRQHRFELAAWQIIECGKPWAEADADVAEAIDFCRYYAAQMRDLDQPAHFDVPGEENSCFYRPRGVAVVIAPWNFPLAILTGMATAALVAGNSVVLKPAEQSSIVAARLYEILQNIGLPDGVVQFLPGVGEEVGPVLVGSPDVDVIAFTGSRAVGLAINEQAAQPHAAQQAVKHVIAEMGGKNAIIVDSDADLDEAVSGVVQSAFGYAGQKCSACSRVIVLNDCYDEFLTRLIDAARSQQVGPADQPSSMIGPVIDQTAYERIRSYLVLPEEEGRRVLGETPPETPDGGYFVGPQIFVDVPPQGRLSREEIFGPVLAVYRAETITQALALANDTDYALTGGVYSRSPATLKKCRLEFNVGNLYLNRPITGALVGRQPFGGFKLSGVGSKAGGPDYLKQFLIPVCITENTVRRGFAPLEASPPATDATSAGE